MSYETDARLKSFLNTNQLSRERMCLAVLSLDKRFSNIHPRHPQGGPDGGRDIEATYEGEQIAYCAVGFINDANDSTEQKITIKSKFKSDLLSAIKSKNDLMVFVFFTNVNFTLGEKAALIQQANEQGISHCEILDRERLKISLDNTDGLAIRFQYLQISMSETEQAAFFARWGDDIQSVISTGFHRMESTLDRILFLQEAAMPMRNLFLQLELDKTYSAEEIGHFRLFCPLQLKEPKAQILSLLFGSSDRVNRMDKDTSEKNILAEPLGIKHGISRGQWEQRLELVENKCVQTEKKYTLVGTSVSMSRDDITFIDASYRNDGFIRIPPYLSLMDMDDAMYIILLNKNLAQKVKAIRVYSNEYTVQEYYSSDFRIDESQYRPDIPVRFFDEELCDPWVRIRPSGLSSVFHIRFSEKTPKRLFRPLQIVNSLEVDEVE